MFKRVIEKFGDKTIVLASSSPRRQEMLQKVGLKCRLCPSEFEENLKPSDFSTFEEFVEATALGKVNEVDDRLRRQGTTPDLIIGADTMVTLNGQLFGKPTSEEDAFNTLKTLSGKAHVVYSGVALKMGDKVMQFTQSTKVYIADMTDEEIKAYVDTGEPMDKAGSYGIQGIGACLVEKIEGDFFTVMGLPLYKLSKELQKLAL